MVVYVCVNTHIYIYMCIYVCLFVYFIYIAHLTQLEVEKSALHGIVNNKKFILKKNNNNFTKNKTQKHFIKSLQINQGGEI